MGLPLHRIKDIRLLYSMDPWGSSEINFDDPQVPPTPRGHVIAARITSENPDEVRFNISLLDYYTIAFSLWRLSYLPNPTVPLNLSADGENYFFSVSAVFDFF